MKKHIPILTYLLSMFFWNGSFTQDYKRANLLAEKEVFSAGYPKTLSFRNDRLLLKKNFSSWEEAHINYNGITKKYLAEEIDITPMAAQWANKYAEKHPNKLMLVHLNGEGRSVNDPTTHERYFPGHWVYEVGSQPTHDITPEQNKIALNDASRFSLKAYTVHGKDIGVDKVPHDIIIVELDDSGNRLWNNFEYASLKNVDYDRHEIEVKRGRYGTKSRNFVKGKTYIAPIAGDIWGGNLMWYYNLSSACPLDKNGHSAAEVFVSEMKGWFGEGGTLEHLDGIGFDVNYFEVKHKSWDCDNDGIVDNGVIKGKNIWREGDMEFLQKIRDAFGPDFIITSDGWNDNMQRAVGILNGMESEGLCRWNDGFRQISRTINQHSYWNLHNNAKHKFSYITAKLRNPADEKIACQLRRMGLGLASCLDVAYAPSPDLTIPEMLGGQLNQPNWLGQPIGAMRYVLNDHEDLLKGKGLTMSDDLIQQFDLNNIVYSVENGQLIIEGSAKNRREELIIPGPDLKVESGDILIFFEAKAIDGFIDLDQGSRIPRKINIKMDGLPEYPKEPMRGHLMYNDLAGFMGTNGYTPLMFYFRNVGGADLKMIFEVEEQGRFAIRNLKVFNSSCLISREFENGVVLVNPSFETVQANLNQVFPKEKKYQRLTTSTKNYQSIKIKDTNSVIIPSLDALFLLKN